MTEEKKSIVPILPNLSRIHSQFLQQDEEEKAFFTQTSTVCLSRRSRFNDDFQQETLKKEDVCEFREIIKTFRSKSFENEKFI